MRRAKIYAGIILLFIFNKSGLTQQLRLGNNPYTVEKSAVLELVSSNQGLLLPRIADTTLINSMSPPDGMIIYFTPDQHLYLRSNGSWKDLALTGSVVTSLNGNTGALTMDTGYISNFHSKVRSLFSASAPITYSAGQIGITQATISTNGYLSSTDWNTFNNKLSTSRLINTTAPLTGGGDLTADRTLSINTNGISNSLIRQSAALSVIGNSTNATANVADITAGTDGFVLRRSGTTLDFGTIATAGITNSAVTYVKIQDVTATNRLLGRATAGSGVVEEITLGTGLSYTGTTLNVGSVPNASLSNSTIGLSLGTSGADANVSGSPASLGGSLTLNLPSASASNRGLLTSADWTTFNNKQAAGNYLIDPAANGIVARTALNITINRTITGTANRISLSNGDGVSGNPTIDISSSYVGQNTITTLGTIGTGTWNGSVIGATYGGTGQSSYTTGDILYASSSTALSKLASVAAGSYLRSAGTSTAPVWSTTTLPNSATTGDLLYASAGNTYSNLAGVATGNALISGGVSTAPSWGKIGLTTHVSGTLPIANGGTNSSTALNNNRIMVSSGGSITEAAALTDGQLLIGSTGNAPTAATLTAGYGISVTNGSGSVTITNTSPAYRTLVTTTSDFTLNYKDTLSNIPGLSFTATAGVLYRFQIIFVHENIGGTGDYVDYALNGPALTYMGALFAMGKSATTFEFGSVNTYNATTTAANVLVGINIVRIDGMIKTSATGTVIFRAMPKNINKGSIKAGASLEYW